MSARKDRPFKMPEVADDERLLSLSEGEERKRRRWQEIRKNCSFVLISIAFFPLLQSPWLWLPLVLIIIAFVIWPQQQP